MRSIRHLKRATWRKPRYIGVLVAVAVILVASFFFDNGNAKIDDTNISNIQTYRLVNAAAAKRVAQSTFRLGDPIQVGFDYAGPMKARTDTLVQFVVTADQKSAPLSTTTMFRLDPNQAALFVNINNTNLPAGNYTVQLRDVKARVVAQSAFAINAK